MYVYFLVLPSGVWTCTAKLSMLHMERHYRNEIIPLLLIIITTIINDTHKCVLVGCLFNLLPTDKCSSGTDLLRQLSMLPHWDKRRKNQLAISPSHCVLTRACLLESALQRNGEIQMSTIIPFNVIILYYNHFYHTMQFNSLLCWMYMLPQTTNSVAMHGSKGQPLSTDFFPCNASHWGNLFAWLHIKHP